MLFFSLKTKMSIAVSLLVIVLMVAFAILIISHFEMRFKETVSAQQYALITEIARDVDETIKSNQRTLIAIAKICPLKVAEDPALAQSFLNNRPTLQTIFEKGISLFSRTGIMMGAFPERKGQETDFPFREYISKTIETAKPQVSEPYFSAQSNHRPTIMLTAPVFGNDGKVVAVLAGCLDLANDNILGGQSRVKIGKTGYLYLINTNRTIIMHPDQRRILQQDEPPGANPVLDKVIAGFNGTEETVDYRGVHALTSVRHLNSVNWILAANYPVAEAYAPIQEATRYSIMAVFTGGILSILIVWLFMRIFTAPLIMLTRHIRDISEHTDMEKEICIDTADEIEELAKAYNGMMRRLHNKQDELRKLSRAVAQSASLVTITDIKGNIEYVNPKFCERTGYDPEELVGKNFRLMKSGDQPKEVYRQLLETIIAGNEWHGEFHNRKKNGDLFWTIATISPIKNEHGDITHFIAVQEDITARKGVEAKLRYVSTHDMLTGLYNRSFFEEEMQRLARSRRFPVSIISVDVDGLKSVNDTLGHETGDRLLRIVGDLLLAAFRAEDILARIGGDEFAVILPATDENAAEEALKRIRKCLDDTNVAIEEFSVSISLGVATAEKEGDLHQTLKLSDERMYKEKYAKKGMPLPQHPARLNR